MNKSYQHIIGLLYLASLIVGVYTLLDSFPSTNAFAANIINGKTPDDIDDSPCSESELLEYVEKAKKSISNKWQPIKGFEDRNVVAVFTVRQNGNIEDSKIVESSGSQAVDQSALDALKASSPLASLPKGAPEFIQVRYVFSWHVTHKYDRTQTPVEASAQKKH